MKAYPGVVPARMPLVSFKGNVAHSMQNGIQFESQNFDGENNPKVRFFLEFFLDFSRTFSCTFLTFFTGR